MSFKISSLIWLRGLDLNQRPLGYEFYNINCFIELAGVVGCHEKACLVLRKFEESCVWVGFGLRVDPNVKDNLGTPVSFGLRHFDFNTGEILKSMPAPVLPM